MSKIAICDDDINLLSTLRKILKKIGFEVYCTRSADELFSLLDETKIDVLIIDFNLEPESLENTAKNGLHIISEIREKYNRPEMKIVLTTSQNYAQIDDVRKVGGDEILYKPFFPLTKLTELLSGLMK